MKIKLSVLGCALLFFILTIWAAADVTGKWAGTSKRTRQTGEVRESTVFLTLKQSGPEITGTAGENESEQIPISKGKIEGDNISFEVVTSESVFKVALSLVNDRLQGEAITERDGAVRKATLDLKRKTE
ncbi:MAG TPA: hypothetical protein VGK99_00615 [Acidobacteriota bacterium]|jgi:hypothetical protein